MRIMITTSVPPDMGGTGGLTLECGIKGFVRGGITSLNAIFSIFRKIADRMVVPRLNSNAGSGK